MHEWFLLLQIICQKAERTCVYLQNSKYTHLRFLISFLQHKTTYNFGWWICEKPLTTVRRIFLYNCSKWGGDLKQKSSTVIILWWPNTCIDTASTVLSNPAYSKCRRPVFQYRSTSTYCWDLLSSHVNYIIDAFIY